MEAWAGAFCFQGGRGRIGDIGFPRGGVVPPRDWRGLSRGGVGLTPKKRRRARARPPRSYGSREEKKPTTVNFLWKVTPLLLLRLSANRGLGSQFV
jgi:hypothetical protein